MLQGDKAVVRALSIYSTASLSQSSSEGHVLLLKEVLSKGKPCWLLTT